jgi:predicted enzyme related to lactoylglutathione lyase
MSRLMYVIVFTSNFDAMREFYEEGVGLRIRHREPEWIEFDTAGAVLALHEMSDTDKPGIDLRFEAAELESVMRGLEARGVKIGGRVVTSPKGRVADVWDPEGNLLSLFEPAVPAPSGAGPLLGSVILHPRDYIRAASFYRDRMGFRVAEDASGGLWFDTGGTRLAVNRPAAGADRPRHAEEPVTFAFETDDLTAWAEAMRGRGIHFLTAPVLEDSGVYAEIVDPDGRVVVLREEPSPASLEERLAEPFEDEAPRRIAIRKPIKKGSAAVSQLMLKPNYKPKEEPKRRRPSATTRSVVSVRGAGPDHARLRPKKTADEKKARAKPAIGRLKKAERATFASQKRAVASASKGRPVKRASANGGRGRAGRRTAGRVARRGR